jgi:16S rRNA (guanine527-N7)-methyltransferase
VAFLNHVVSVLGLTQITIVHQRIQDYHPIEQYDWVLARAFSSLSDFVQCSGHVRHPQGAWVAMKGDLQETELAEIRASHQIVVQGLQVPEDTRKRCVVFIT